METCRTRPPASPAGRGREPAADQQLRGPAQRPCSLPRTGAGDESHPEQVCVCVCVCAYLCSCSCVHMKV